MTSSSHLIAGALFLHAFLFAFQGYFPFVAENNPDLLLFFQLLPITLLGALFLDLDAEKSRISKLGVFQLPIFSEK
ncbi:MAG: hypothetical protein U9Q15_05200 [Patescibacteria group bacterium]|nr:hypothetical protein [Patescibacteria group bacterium]